jgi:MFS family permease
MLLLTVAAGATLGPLVAAETQLVGELVPESRRTEGFAVVLTAGFVGFGAGMALAGLVVEPLGWHWTLAATCSAAALAAGLLIVLREALVAEPWNRVAYLSIDR